MIRLLLMTLLTLFGFENNKPYDLRKQVTLTEKVKAWFNRHKYRLLLIIIIVAMIMAVIALVKFFPAMDPWTNRFDEVI